MAFRSGVSETAYRLRWVILMFVGLLHTTRTVTVIIALYTFTVRVQCRTHMSYRLPRVPVPLSIRISQEEPIRLPAANVALTPTSRPCMRPAPRVGTWYALITVQILSTIVHSDNKECCFKMTVHLFAIAASLAKWEDTRKPAHSHTHTHTHTCITVVCTAQTHQRFNRMRPKKIPGSAPASCSWRIGSSTHDTVRHAPARSAKTYAPRQYGSQCLMSSLIFMTFPVTLNRDKMAPTKHSLLH